MKNLHVLIKPASSLCGLRCGYCFYRDMAAARDVESYGIMTLETLEAVVRRVCTEVTGEAHFIFQGGEPLMAGLDFFREFEKMAAAHAPAGLRVMRSVQTNATLITDEWARFFAEHGYLVGVSLDGPADINNPQRPFAGGKGSFSAIMAGIRCLERAKVPYNILTVVTEPVARRGAAVYAFMRKNGWDYMQFIPCIDPVLGERNEFSLKPETYAKFLETTFDLYFDDLAHGKRVSVRWFDNIAGLLRGSRPESCGISGVCVSQIVIEADGGVYPCDFYVKDEYRLGSVLDMSFDEMLASDTARSFVEASRALPEKCRECPAYPLCRNGCRRYRAPYLGDAPGVNVLCEAYRRFFDGRMDRLMALARVRR